MILGWYSMEKLDICHTRGWLQGSSKTRTYLHSGAYNLMITHPLLFSQVVGSCSIRYLVVIWLTPISDFVYLYISKQSCMRHVFYRPIYGIVPRAYNGTFCACSFLINWKLWVGVNRSVLIESIKWINRDL